MQQIVDMMFTMQDSSNFHPLVSAIHWTRSNHDGEDFYYYDDNGEYVNPYYNSGSSAFGEWFASIDWEYAGTIAMIVLIYATLSAMGPLLFPPMLICLFLEEGDLEKCSLGTWSNGYRDPELLCHDRQWKDELSDA